MREIGGEMYRELWEREIKVDVVDKYANAIVN